MRRARRPPFPHRAFRALAAFCANNVPEASRTVTRVVTQFSLAGRKESVVHFQEVFHRSEKSIVGIYFIYWPIDQKLGGLYSQLRDNKSILSKFSRGTKEEYFIEENYSYPPSRYYKLREHFLLRKKKKRTSYFYPIKEWNFSCSR